MKQSSAFWVNFVFCVINLVFFFMSPTDAISIFNLGAGLVCGYWAYEAATRV